MSQSAPAHELVSIEPSATYASLAALLYGSEERAGEVQKHALDLVEGNRPLFMPAVEEQARSHHQHHALDFLTSDVFGSVPVGLEAIAIVYQITLEVRRKRGGDAEVYTPDCERAQQVPNLQLFLQESLLAPGTLVKITYPVRSTIRTLLSSLFSFGGSSTPSRTPASSSGRASRPAIAASVEGHEEQKENGFFGHHHETPMDAVPGANTGDGAGGDEESAITAPAEDQRRSEGDMAVNNQQPPERPMEMEEPASSGISPEANEGSSDVTSTESPFSPARVTIKSEPANNDGRPRAYPINEIQYALADAETRKVLMILDEISAVLGEELARQIGLDFPEIILIGQESAGKSSVLERIAMLPIFPRGEGIVTRMPIRLQLTRAHGKAELETFCAKNDVAFDERGFYFRAAVVEHEQRPSNYDWTPWYGPISGNTVLDNDNFQADVPVAKVMQEAIRTPTGESMGVNEQSIILVEIVSRQVPNIRLLDLPGIVGASLEGEPLDMAERTERLVKKYLQRPDSLVVIVVEATSSSVRNSKAFQLAQQANKINQAVGVLTKSDLCTEHYLTKLRQRLKGEAQDCPKLEYGYVAVKNRGHEQTPLREAAEEEHRFFMEALSDCAEGSQQLVGIGALLHHLRQMLTQYTRKHWAPDTKRRVQRQLKNVEAELAQLGIPVPAIDSEKPVFMQAVTSTLMARCRQRVGVGTPAEAASGTLFEHFMRCMDAVDMKEQLQQAIAQLGLAAIAEPPACEEAMPLEQYVIELAQRYSATCLLALYTQVQSAVFQRVVDVLDMLCTSDGVIAELAVSAMRDFDESPDRIHRFHQLHQILAHRLAFGVQAHLPSQEELQRNIERLSHQTPLQFYEAIQEQGLAWLNHMQATSQQYAWTVLVAAVVRAACSPDIFSIEDMLQSGVEMAAICAEDPVTAAERQRLNQACDILKRCMEHIRLIIPGHAHLPSSEPEVIVIDDDADEDDDGDNEPEQKRSRN